MNNGHGTYTCAWDSFYVTGTLNLCSSGPHFHDHESMFLTRLGEAIDRTLLSHLLKMFTALGMYSESFEKPFLECTSEFYATEGVKYMQQSDIPDYLKHVEVFLNLFCSCSLLGLSSQV